MLHHDTAPRRSRVRFLSSATLRALTQAHDAMVCTGMSHEAAAILEGVHNGGGLSDTVRALQTAEWHATAIATEAAEIGDALLGHRARLCADACGSATRRLLADYERAAERAA